MKRILTVAISVSLLAGCASNPVPGESPSEVATPVVTASLSSDFKYRIVGSEVERKGNVDLDWTSESFYPLDPTSVRARAFAAIKAAANGSANTPINLLIGENVPASMEAAYMFQIKQALQFFDFSGMVEPIDILIYTEKDKELMQSYWKPMYSGGETIERKLYDLSGYEENPTGWSVGGGADLRHKRDGTYPRIGIDFAMSSAHTEEEHLLVEHVAHEMAHVWQWHVSGMAKRANNAESFDIADYLPCHALEGGANTIGIPIAVEYDDWYAEAADVILRRVARDFTFVRVTEEAAIDMLERSEDWSTCGEGFAVGMLAYEWLAAEFGAEALFDVFRNAGQKMTFEDSIKKITGLNKAEFYRAVAPHIVETYTKALKKIN